MDLSTPVLPIALPPTLAKPLQAPAAGTAHDDAATRARIAKAGKDYESAFLSMMFGQMMEGVSAGNFGGGQGEEMFKSFLTDAMAKSMVRHGGIGLAKVLSADMLKLQGLAQTPPATPQAASPGQPASQPGQAATAPAKPVAPTLDIAA